MQIFWRRGYEATSMAELVRETGLNKSSIYNAFGSKERLYELVVERYLKERGELMDAILTHGERGLDDVLAMFELMRTEVHGELGRLGCLAANTSTELGQTDTNASDLACFFQNAMSSGFKQALSRAGRSGEIDGTKVDDYANVLVALVFGMSAIVRSGVSLEDIDRHLDATTVVVEGWRRES